LVLSLGLLVAYVGNVFRMVVIGVVGYYHGMEALLWAHDNVGWIVFLAWSSIFWYLVIRYADRRRSRSKTVEQSERTSSQP
jgi:exosortase/archaeosortase family protein